MDNYTKKIKDIFKTIKQNDEFEVMFNNYRRDNKLLINDFMNVMKYIKYRSETENKKLITTTDLDIQYSPDIETVYRFTISTSNTINNFLELVNNKKNNKIISILVKNFLSQENYSLIQKIKKKENILDIDDFNIRIRKSSEIPVSKDKQKELSELTILSNDKIIFRLKQRLSFVISNDLSVDLTIIKMTDTINKINNTNKNYELEIDYSPNNLDLKKLDTIMNEIIKIKKVLIQNNNIISTKEEELVIKGYTNLMYNTNKTFNNLYSMQPINAEVQHFIDDIPDKYSATDKADGDKYVIFIFNKKLYLISNNLNIKFIKNINNLKETILEGEYIYLSNEKKYIMMVYDCLYFDGKDMRDQIELKERLIALKKALNIIQEKNNYYYIKDLSSNFKYNIENIKKFYQSEIENYFNNLNFNIQKSKELLIYPKIFLFPLGFSKSEVYLYSSLLWNNCTKNKKINCPYFLDGIIYTGIKQKYSRDKKNQKFPIYKFKPPSTNSIDVYIQFQRNKETNNFMDFYDNSLPDTLKDINYRVINFLVGDTVNQKERPVPFMPEVDNDQGFFPLIDGHVRDVKNNIVQDKTVVELTYDIDSKLPHQYRWSILRTRWDKTESVMRDKKKYGNYNDTAIRVWKSMKESITIEEITNLANPSKYNLQIKSLAQKLSKSIITSQKGQDKYYQKVTNLIKKLREFHNWIKSIIIYTYCTPVVKKYNGKPEGQSILDIGCGRGGDIHKIYHARVKEYVGIDINYEDLYSATNGAVSRYNHLKKILPGFGKVQYIQADGSIIFNSKEQEKKINNMSKENKNLLDKVFTKDKKFDIISSQFVIHYLFSDSTSIKNLISNIQNFLKKDGYILLTLFDGDLVHKKFTDNKIVSSYTNEDGQRIKLFEIIKKYDGDIKNKTGQAIDVHMSWVSNEDTYIEEYLVTKELMTKVMKHAGCRLVETDLFSNIYNLNKDYFMNVIQFEENEKNKKFYEKVKMFYNDLKGADKESKDWSFLFRYYIFQKIE